MFAANKGVGYGIAKILAEQGLTTVVAARNGELGFCTRIHNITYQLCRDCRRGSGSEGCARAQGKHRYGKHAHTAVLRHVASAVQALQQAGTSHRFAPDCC